MPTLLPFPPSIHRFDSNISFFVGRSVGLFSLSPGGKGRKKGVDSFPPLEESDSPNTCSLQCREIFQMFGDRRFLDFSSLLPLAFPDRSLPPPPLSPNTQNPSIIHSSLSPFSSSPDRHRRGEKGGNPFFSLPVLLVRRIRFSEPSYYYYFLLGKNGYLYNYI